MLRSVHLKNFVNFEEKQFLDFNGSGPYIFIGENGAGKSCVLEGIRRCLHTKYSTSSSSSFNTDKLSYFICNFEIAKDEYIISGVVAKPDDVNTSNTGEADSNEQSNSEEGIPQDENLAYYKFSLYHTKERNESLSKYRLIRSTNQGCIDVHKVKSIDESENENSKQYLLDAIMEKKKSDNKPDEGDLLEKFLLSEFKTDNLQNDTTESANQEDPEDKLTGKVVFTFPLRSIGPLQWSESSRISFDDRDTNYTEAEQRCEIIRYFLKHIDQFNKEKEEYLFKALTRSDAYNFELKKDINNDVRLLLNGEKFALLKTPEGILEAKVFSILMSGKHYKTIILEEPDRGMHPQFIERMIHLIKQSQGVKRVILTTHNTAFITPWSLSDCFVFRRREEECCIVSGKALVIDTKEPKHERIQIKTLRLLTSDHLSDILFAKRVLFCEGDSDFLFLTELKQQLLTGVRNIMKKNKIDSKKLEESLVILTIIKMNGKGNTQLFMDVSKRMKLDAIFLLDKDAEEQNFESKEKIFFWKFGDIDDMVIQMCEAKAGLKDKLQKQNVNVNQNKFQMKKKRKNKLFLRDKVEVKHIEAATRLLLEHCEPESDLVAFIKFLY